MKIRFSELLLTPASVIIVCLGVGLMVLSSFLFKPPADY